MSKLLGKSMNLPDLFSGCYSGEHQRQSPEQFKAMFCGACQNAGCKNSRTAQSAWMLRILTQEDRLLINPQFAADGAGDALPDFKDLLHKALALEVSGRKGDWNPVSETEVRDAARELVGLPPTGFVSEKPVGLPKPPPKVERWTVKGDHGDSYDVSLTETGDWGCTCKGFTFKRDCKHVADLKLKLSRQPVEQATEVGHTSRPAPFLPPAQNTHMPSTGIMIGGADAPQQPPVHDPWAVPEKAIKVGGRIVLGGGKS